MFDELKLYFVVCEKWGVDVDVVEVYVVSWVYVEFLEFLYGKFSFELVVGMISCMRLYAYVGWYFFMWVDVGVDGIFDLWMLLYVEWFEVYGGDEMEFFVCCLESLLFEEIEDERVVDNYVEAIRFECDFFVVYV